jgi:CHAT domain-containing protein/tetratricopeptide (TPR) repeat protein
VELHQRALAIREAATPASPGAVAESLSNLAGLYSSMDRREEAEGLYRRALSVREAALPSDHSSIANSLNNLASYLQSEGRLDEAEPLFKRSYAIMSAALPEGHSEVAVISENLAFLHLARNDWEQSLGYLRSATNALSARARRTGSQRNEGLTGADEFGTARGTSAFLNQVRAAHRLGLSRSSATSSLATEAFVAAQWATGSDAADALVQASVRSGTADAELAGLVRERQDLVRQWDALDKQAIAARAVEHARRSPEAEAVLAARAAAIQSRVRQIDTTLAGRFPQFASLVFPEPLSIAEVQAELGSGEALMLFLEMPDLRFTLRPMPHLPLLPEETFIWVVTKTDVRWVRSDLGKGALNREVAALRCGLDAAAWENEGGQKCAGLLKVPAPGDNAPLQFDLMRAHALYHALFGQVEDLIRDKHLRLVPSGALTAFPFQALVTARPATAGNYVNAPWLIKRHAVTVLPSVASLKSLRQFAKASKAIRPFIGFGNPLLVGPDGTDKRAWSQQSCQESAPLRVASRSVRGSIGKFFRSGLADVEVVRAQYPLPETADELCAVARLTGSQQDAVYLGEKATETTIKVLSANGTLAQARVVHFATHGLLAGETEMLGASRAEPALLLTPPALASEEDDGLLTASEISQLKLDADWVVLSACNTAASDKPGAEALSGLARAFFYAGARALLVSHWAVNSDSTVKLITQAFDEIKADPQLGRAEAMRRSMVAMIGIGGLAHPSLWAPFVIVGEGAPAR